MSVIAIGIVDNDVITVKALAALLERNDDFHVIWTASSGRQAIVNCLEDERWPDVLLVDAELGDELGTEVCRRLRAGNGECAMLVITAYPPERYRRDAARAGAQGIVGKADYPWLERAIRLVHAGRVFAVPSPWREGADAGGADGSGEADDVQFLPPAEARRRLLAQTARSAGAGAGVAVASPASRLSFQESQVLAMSADGLTQNEIADRLDITPASVRTHSMRARRKLGAATLTQAVVTWLRQIGRR